MVFLLALFLPLTAQAETFEEIYQATCAIYSVGVGSGTGVVFAEDKTDLWIVTAAHVILDEDKHKLVKKYYVRFYINGRKSHLMRAKPLWHKFKYETTTAIAFLKVKKSDFKRYPLPKPIKIAPKNTGIKKGQVIRSAGAPDDRSTAFQGHIFEVWQDKYKFVPSPRKGRSGSGLFTDKGLIGIVIWHQKYKPHYGTSTSLKKIYKDTQWK